MMDENKMIETVGEGAKAVSSITDLIHAVIGSRISRNQAKTNLSIAEKYAAFIRENPDLEIAFTEDNFVSVRARTPNELLERGLIRETNEIMIHQENLESIAEKALSLIPENAEPEEPVDFDWLMRFKDAAKNVSTEEMQFIWAKILAGEYQKPGCISLRTLEVVKNLSKEEAELFCECVSLAFGCFEELYILADSAFLGEKNIAHSTILTLDECGLLEYGGGNISFNYSIEQKQVLIFEAGNWTIQLINPNELTVNGMINVYRLTSAGRDLYRIIEHSSSGKTVQDIAKSILDSYVSNWSLVNDTHLKDKSTVPRIIVKVIQQNESCKTVLTFGSN